VVDEKADGILRIGIDSDMERGRIVIGLGVNIHFYCLDKLCRLCVLEPMKQIAAVSGGYTRPFRVRAVLRGLASCYETVSRQATE
jgi:hypothetical protein